MPAGGGWQVVHQLAAVDGVAHYPWSPWLATHAPVEQVLVAQLDRAMARRCAMFLFSSRRLHGQTRWHAHSG